MPVDPLATHYDRLLRRFDIQPAARTIGAHGERLLRHFPRESFDIAFAVNSLDHSYDPLLIVANMLDLVVGGRRRSAEARPERGRTQVLQRTPLVELRYRPG